MLFFESVEILRRTVWAIFRIEWEVVAKVLYPSGQYQALTEREEDEEDEDEDEDAL